MNMREAVIMVPRNNNSGVAIPHVLSAAVSAVITAWGGATVRDAFGYWMDGGELYQEPMHEVAAAMPPTDENDNRLRQMAMAIGQHAGQLAMYVRYASGAVEIIDIPAAARAAA